MVVHRIIAPGISATFVYDEAQCRLFALKRTAIISDQNSDS
jgi:hypothetical protein